MIIAPKLRVVLAVCLALLFSSAATADVTAWNQAEVTQVAKQLADASNVWQTALAQQTAGGQMSDRMMDLQDNTRIIRDKSMALAAKLGAGKGRDDVAGEYMSLKETVDYTSTNLQYVSLEKPSLEAWAKFSDTLKKIGPYFDAKGGS